jgi:hypothetical protein
MQQNIRTFREFITTQSSTHTRKIVPVSAVWQKAYGRLPLCDRRTCTSKPCGVLNCFRHFKHSYKPFPNTSPSSVYFSGNNEWVMVFTATFNNGSAISWRSVLLMEDTGENHHKGSGILVYCGICEYTYKTIFLFLDIMYVSDQSLSPRNIFKPP